MDTIMAEPERLRELKALWQQAFGDEEAFTDAFFHKAYDPAKCRLICRDGRVAAALYWFDCHFRGRRFAYLYGVATDRAWQGRGLCRMLMADTARELARQGYAGLLLYPASASLAGMYEKMGYRFCTWVAEREFSQGAIPAEMTRLDRDAYARARRQLLPEGGAVQEGPLLDLLAEFAEFYQGADFLAALTVEDGCVRCLELLGRTGAAPEILRAMGAERGIFRFPGGEKPFAMGLLLDGEGTLPGYFGLPLD